MKFALVTFSLFSMAYGNIIDAKNYTKVEVSTPKGEIKIVGTDTKKIEINLEKIKFDPKCNYSVKEGNSTLKIIIDQENILFDKATCETKLEIKMPKEMALKVSTGASNTQIDNMKSEIDFKSASGNLVALGLTNNLNVMTANGSINLNYSNCNERTDVEIVSASSDSEIKLPKDCKIKVAHRSATGDLFNEIGESKNYKFKISMKSASGSLKILKQ